MSIAHDLQGFDAYQKLIERIEEKRMDVIVSLKNEDGNDLYRAQGEMRALDFVYDVLHEEPEVPTGNDNDAEYDHYA